MSTTPVDQDAINPNILTELQDLQNRVAALERGSPLGLFDGNTMRPPGVLEVRGGNFRVNGHRSIHSAIFNLGPAVVLTIDTDEVTISQSYHKIAAESGTADDLVTINGGVDGDVIILIADTGDTITITETGNITTNLSTVDMGDDEYFLAIYNEDTGKWVGDIA